MTERRVSPVVATGSASGTPGTPGTNRATPVLDDAGPAAPPRKNGELVFASLWEGRLFGLTMALHEAGLFEWDEFRQRLIAAIARWESDDAGRRCEWSYYGRWLEAFEALLVDKRLCTPENVQARVRDLAARPKGHDH